MRFHDLLNKETNLRTQLSQQLDETKQQLAHQRSLKEMHINKGKELKSQLERMEKYANAETLSTSKIAAQVRDNIKQKKKKLLQKDYEELKVAYTISQKKFTAEIQLQNEKTQALKEELDQLRVSYQEVSLKYDTAVLRAKQQVDNLQQLLEKEIKSHTDRQANDTLLIQNLRDEIDTVCQNVAGEIEDLRFYTADKETVFLKELDELKTQLSIQTSLNFELEAEMEAERRMPRCKCRQNEDKPQLKHNISFKKEESLPKVDSEPKPTEVHVEVLNTETSPNLELSTELTAEPQDHLSTDTRTAECEEQQEERSEEEQEMETGMKSCHADSDPEPMKNIEVSLEALTSVQTDQDLPPERKTAECEEQQEGEFEGKAENMHKIELGKQERSLTNGIPNPDPTETIDASDGVFSKTTQNKSLWKRARHFLRLKKPSWGIKNKGK
ncbi:hypothetical protein EXN66_Car007884 [Channa argus]|uniref:Uncharacterized protein n=1 Tax=Channa argus TaxID=215402 RepID=A0A6G1PQE8_CHAAH|nr:hypothetical protein EXN66_Car007884 [Channa argus]KAK2909952.1 hypothetical protein Q8A73_007667 [Channa argus]